ncbi:hypothetical protein CU097_015688 [Rhizopus azygosporus]|uniref:Zn(2)-C6 fungal-type domain-containing protein n=1 Tax=Rhizopus azygosporus TaxID=86630 RepID=A0A367KD22_RHIAZ|nr:hypothetical protein CU097_015688 [Rhizopus azygosporus]
MNKQVETDKIRRKRLKVISACGECRRKKTKCNGEYPCSGCLKARVECKYVTNQKPGAPTSIIRERLNNNVHLITQPIRKKSLNSPPSMVEPLATPTVLPPSEQPQQQQQQRHQFQQHQPQQQQQQQQQQNNTTHHIQSIEERLSAIENILRTLLGSGRHKHLLQNLDHNNAPLPPPQPSPRYPSLYPNPPMLDQQQYSDVLSCRDIYHPPVHVSYIQNGSLSREKRKRDDQDIVVKEERDALGPQLAPIKTIATTPGTPTIRNLLNDDPPSAFHRLSPTASFSDTTATTTTNNISNTNSNTINPINSINTIITSTTTTPTPTAGDLSS